MNANANVWLNPQDATNDFVQVIDVVKQFGATTAISHVHLSIRKKEIFALLGSSGCGKSTLLRILAGFETATSGRILIDGEHIAKLPPYRRPVNMLFLSYALFPHMTAEANISFGLKQEKRSKAEIRERVASALDLEQMGRFANRKPQQLSGGQQQRAALARNLVKRPKLLLLDEPMSALGKQIRQRTQLELIDILEQVGVTCMMVTHDQEEAMVMADRIAVMTEGRIVQIGTPHEVYENPNSRFCAEFIGSTNLFSGKIIEDEADHVLIESPALSRRLYIDHGVTEQLGMEVIISLRPERVAVSWTPPARDYNWDHGKVDHIAYRGDYTLYHIVLDSGKKVAANVSSLALSEMRPPTWDEQVFVSWSPDSGVVLAQ